MSTLVILKPSPAFYEKPRYCILGSKSLSLAPPGPTFKLRWMLVTRSRASADLKFGAKQITLPRTASSTELKLCPTTNGISPNLVYFRSPLRELCTEDPY
ncbi:hypothetical protein ACU8KH_06605 [Lachancea thermotolerans]